VKLVKKLKTTPVTTGDVFITAPSFDHAAKDPVPEAMRIPSHTRLVIVEGNYTLLKQKPWDEIAEACDQRLVLIYGQHRDL
jgi:pantothenate kinase